MPLWYHGGPWPKMPLKCPLLVLHNSRSFIIKGKNEQGKSRIKFLDYHWSWNPPFSRNPITHRLHSWNWNGKISEPTNQAGPKKLNSRFVWHRSYSTVTSCEMNFQAYQIWSKHWKHWAVVAISGLYCPTLSSATSHHPLQDSPRVKIQQNPC